MQSSAEAITSSVDDSSIERASAFKQLASWGGFRRHYVEGGSREEGGWPHNGEAPAVATNVSVPLLTLADGGEDNAAWRYHLHEQLLAKRAEVLATQRKLQSLSLEQRELERLYTRTS